MKQFETFYETEHILFIEDIMQIFSADLPKTVFFDIETTGFTEKNSSLYLIGCAYFKKENVYIRQWFAESPEEELLLLQHFSEFLQGFHQVVSYNGNGFDIPYLIGKAQKYQLNLLLEEKKSLDIYRELFSMKHILKLMNLKQKSVEEFLGVEREDQYSGKDLINVYKQYIKFTQEPLLQQLLLHNLEDIRGLIQISSMLNYPQLFQTRSTSLTYTIEESAAENGFSRKEWVIQESLDFSLPKRISFGTSDIYLSAYKNSLKIKIKIYTGELKYFYSNYKDYYYLPAEDTSIHKSIAFYVDKDYRTQAKAANCYSKKTGNFAPQYKPVIEPYFKIDYADKTTYFELTPDFLNNEKQIRTYFSHILQYLTSISKK